jgi:hypothetical protein
MFELRRLFESRNVMIHYAQPLMNGWISTADITDIAFEVTMISYVEANDRDVEADVCLRD